MFKIRLFDLLDVTVGARSFPKGGLSWGMINSLQRDSATWHMV